MRYFRARQDDIGEPDFGRQTSSAVKRPGGLFTLPYIPLGPFSISTYALMYSLMYWVIGFYGFVRLMRLPHSPRILGRTMMLVVLGLFLGSILPSLWLTLGNWLWTGVFTWHRSIRVIGGMAVALPTAYFLLRHYGIPVGRAFDLGGAPVPLGLAIGRLGCLAGGCCGGRPSDSRLAMVLPDENGVWTARYPTQLISAAADLAIFCVLISWEKYFGKKAGQNKGFPFDGFLFLVFLDLYFAKRFLVQFLRNDNLPLMGPLSGTHLFFLAGIGAVSSILMVQLFRTKARQGYGDLS